MQRLRMVTGTGGTAQCRVGGRAPPPHWTRRLSNSSEPSIGVAAGSAMRRSFRGRRSCSSCSASTPGGPPASAASQSAQLMATETLRAMALGGMRDHIGGGFHRVLGRRRLARAAFREDAVRPGAAGARVSRSWPGDRRRVLCGGRGGHPRLCAPGHDRSRGRILFGGGRR